jgi:ubiquinone/menaquinone biosynthesis C-methylase UbiE
MATQAPTSPASWQAECDLLQCVDCDGRLEAAEEAVVCAGCGRRYPIRDGLLDALGTLAGNNQVAADFYNGPQWKKFRIWEWLSFLINGGERRARGHVLKHLPPLSGTRLLEVAVGDGANVSLLPDDCTIYGNDISPVQIAACRRRHPQRGLRLLLGEAEKLPFRDDTFDNALSVGAFNYFNDPLGALKEMSRVVKPGGTIVVVDELPDLANHLLGHRIGLPGLDRWVLSRFLRLGPTFTDMVVRHRDLKLEPIVREALDDWKIHSWMHGMGYCIVGKARKA